MQSIPQQQKPIHPTPPSSPSQTCKSLHPRLPLQLLNLPTRLTLPQLPRNILPRLLRHNGNIAHLLPRRRIIARSPALGILDGRAGGRVRVLGLGVLELVDFLGGFGFVQAVGVDVGVFGGGERGDEAFLLFGGGVGAGGPLGGVVELGGHCGGVRSVVDEGVGGIVECGVIETGGCVGVGFCAWW